MNIIFLKIYSALFQYDRGCREFPVFDVGKQKIHEIRGSGNCGKMHIYFYILYAFLDGHVCWNSSRRLPFIVCQPRNTNFRFPSQCAANKRKFVVSAFRLQQTNGNCRFLLVPFFIYIYIYTVYIYQQMVNGLRKIA